MLKRIKTKLRELIQRVRDYQFDRFWNNKIQQALTNFSSEEQDTVRTVLRNQLEYHKMERTAYSTSSFKTNGAYIELVFDVVVEVFKNLRTVFNIVGVQSMQGPVGLVYYLVFKGGDGPNISLNVISAAVQAGTRKLQSGWSVDGISEPHYWKERGIDLRQELVLALGAEISTEIVQEIINDLVFLSTTRDVVDFKSAEPGDFTRSIDLLFVKINSIMNEIARKTRRGPGNFIVAGPAMASTFSLCEKYKELNSKEINFSGLQHVGDFVYTDTHKVPVYQNMMLKENTILVGYKGKNGQCDVGYVYCPYIPVMLSDIVLNPGTFSPMISTMTRYGKGTFEVTENSTSSSGDYYGILEVNNFSFK